MLAVRTLGGEHHQVVDLVEDGGPDVVGDQEDDASVVGELAMLYSVPRTATIEASEKTSTTGYFVLDRFHFHHTLRDESISRRREVEILLRLPACELTDALGEA